MIITVIGFGAMGSSIASAIKLISEDYNKVFVYDKNCNYSANQIDLSNYYEFSLIRKEILIYTLFKSDLIIVATPLFASKEVAEIINKSQTNAVIIDLCSVKQPIIDIFKDTLTANQFKNYVPCHPLAGTEESGFQYCNPYLFTGRQICISLHPNIDIAAFDIVCSFWTKNLKSVINLIGSETHDKFLANTSHLIHLLSFYLASQYNQLKELNSFKDDLNIPSMKEVLRLSESNKDLWEDIFKNNKKYLTDSITSLQTFLDMAKTHLKNNEKIF